MFLGRSRESRRTRSGTLFICLADARMKKSKIRIKISIERVDKRTIGNDFTIETCFYVPKHKDNWLKEKIKTDREILSDSSKNVCDMH